MKMKVFIGEWYEAQDAFNNWAKGKALQRDILIQTNSQYVLTGAGYKHFLTIVVIHSEDPEYDKTEKTLTAPVHDVPIPHIKVEEIKVTP